MLELKLNEDLIWSSDWSGDEVGHDQIGVVGCYSLKVNPNIMMYIDMEKMEILEVWSIGEDD